MSSDVPGAPPGWGWQFVGPGGLEDARDAGVRLTSEEKACLAGRCPNPAHREGRHAEGPKASAPA